jgi:hypothetical protein
MKLLRWLASELWRLNPTRNDGQGKGGANGVAAHIPDDYNV